MIRLIAQRLLKQSTMYSVRDSSGPEPKIDLESRPLDLL